MTIFDDSMQVEPLEDLLNQVADTLSARVQSGTATIVISAANTPTTLNVIFPVAFPSPPNVVATIRSTNAVDTRHLGILAHTDLAVSFVGVNTDSTANIIFDWVAVLP